MAKKSNTKGIKKTTTDIKDKQLINRPPLKKPTPNPKENTNKAYKYM